MPVRIAKPAVNIREKLAELERPIGVNGAALMRTETPQEAFNLIGAGRKNVIINGAMNIWQRGTSFLNLASQGATNYTADRWNATRYSSGDHDVTRQEVNYLGFRYALRSERSVGDSSGTSRYINQPIESSISRTLAGKYVTLSFYARRGAGMPTISGVNLTAWITYHTSDSWLDNGMFYDNFKNISGPYAGTKSFALTENFERYQITGFIPSNVRQIGISFGTPEGLPTAIANDYFDITGVQLEEGRTATPFEHRSIGEELAMCQRYYEIVATSGAYNNTFFLARCNGATQGLSVYSFKVPKRGTPTMTVTGTSSVYTSGSFTSVTSYSNLNAGTHGGRITFDGMSGLTLNDCFHVDLGAGFSLVAEAEL
jgi:hypothetical protein